MSDHDILNLFFFSRCHIRTSLKVGPRIYTLNDLTHDYYERGMAFRWIWRLALREFDTGLSTTTIQCFSPTSHDPVVFFKPYLPILCFTFHLFLNFTSVQLIFLQHHLSPSISILLES